MPIPTSFWPRRWAPACRSIEHRIEPEPLIEGNAYDHKFPERLAAATHACGKPPSA